MLTPLFLSRFFKTSTPMFAGRIPEGTPRVAGTGLVGRWIDGGRTKRVGDEGPCFEAAAGPWATLREAVAAGLLFNAVEGPITMGLVAIPHNHRPKLRSELHFGQLNDPTPSCSYCVRRSLGTQPRLQTEGITKGCFSTPRHVERKIGSFPSFTPFPDICDIFVLFGGSTGASPYLR